MRAGNLLCLLGLVLVTMAMTISSSSSGERPAGKEKAAQANKVLRHIVMYKFKDGLPPEQLQEVIDTFAALPSKIDTIIDFEHGTNVSPEGKSQGLTHCFVVTFRDEKGRDAYLVHPAHLQYVEVVKDRRDQVVVFDYWADAP
jgi:hypothetical protein